MFILPIISNVQILEPLSIRLREFWQRKLSETTYKEELRKKGDSYWVDRTDRPDNDKEIYSFIHKSEEGRPIDLNESADLTRFLSIDASKGNGCNVVFLLNFTHKNIKTRAGAHTDDINYKSFVHVALTRQKRSIYVYLGYKDDKLNDKFIKYDYDEVIIKGRKITQSKSISFQFDRFNIKDFYSDSIKVDNIFNICGVKSLIDMNHHVLRNYAMISMMHIRCITNDKDTTKDHDFMHTMKSIEINKIEGVSSRDYYIWLETPNKNHVEQCVKLMETSKTIPILSMALPIIKVAIEKLQSKIRCNNSKKFCPLEYVAISFVWNIVKFRRFSEFTCTDFYNLVKYYENYATTNHKDEYECGCPSSTDNMEYRNKITNFINEIDSVSNIVNKISSHKFEMSDKLFYECENKKMIMRPMFVSYKICEALTNVKDEYTIYIVQPTFDMITLPQVLIKAEIIKFMFKNCNYLKKRNIKDISIKVLSTSFNELIDIKHYNHCRLPEDKIEKAINEYIKIRL